MINDINKNYTKWKENLHKVDRDALIDIIKTKKKCTLKEIAEIMDDTPIEDLFVSLETVFAEGEAYMDENMLIHHI